MPHLYLPRDHTDADLVLAADVAAAVSSADLYVTWTHDGRLRASPRWRPSCATSARRSAAGPSPS